MKKILLGYFLGIMTVTLISLVLPLSNAIIEQPNLEIPESGERVRASPSNYILQDQVRVFNTHVTLDIENVKWAKFKDTGSMLPIINKDSFALQIEPQCPRDINVGDIVSYKRNEDIIIHRVVHAGEDHEGPYFVLRGDNNPVNDPGKVRCEQIDRKVIGILY